MGERRRSFRTAGAAESEDEFLKNPNSPLVARLNPGRLAELRSLCLLSPALLLLAGSGCVVSQPRGKGALTHETEPRTNRGYYLYLPEAYVKSDTDARRQRRWPLVMTFHGMKPFDTAPAQANEWQQEADRYGYIVIAPELRAPDVLRQFPVRTVSEAFKSDEVASLAILDRVLADTDADPSNVLATSWSSGGYMAHYMVNRHPTRFTCLAVRQSNFSKTIMDPSRASESRYHPILIVNTQNDFKVCQEESAEAVHWYDNHGFQNMWWLKVSELGHERTPDMAADFFGRVAGVGPSAPSSVLARRTVIDGNPEGIAMLAGKLPDLQYPPSFASSADYEPLPATPRRRPIDAAPIAPFAASDAGAMSNPGATPVRVAPPTPRRSLASLAAMSEREPYVSVSASSTFGLQPLYVGFTVNCPEDWTRKADFLWTLDGQELCRGMNGQKTLNEPGVYNLAVKVTAPDGKTYDASRTIRVLPPIRRGGSDDAKTVTGSGS